MTLKTMLKAFVDSPPLVFVEKMRVIPTPRRFTDSVQAEYIVLIRLCQRTDKMELRIKYSLKQGISN